MKKIIIMLFLLNILFTGLYAQDATGDKKENTTAVTNNTNTTTSTNNSITNNTEVKQKKNGWNFYEEGRFIDSINALQEERKYFPDRINIYVILGWDYKEVKNFAEMEKISLEGLKFSNDDARIIKNLAEAYFLQNKHNEAIPQFQKYIFLKNNTNDPYIQTIYQFLGMSYYHTNQLYKADIALSTARFYQKNSVNILITLADIKEKQKDYNMALKYYNEALKLAPSNTQVIDGLNRVKDLKK